MRPNRLNQTFSSISTASPSLSASLLRLKMAAMAEITSPTPARKPSPGMPMIGHSSSLHSAPLKPSAQVQTKPTALGTSLQAPPFSQGVALQADADLAGVGGGGGGGGGDQVHALSMQAWLLESPVAAAQALPPFAAPLVILYLPM